MRSLSLVLLVLVSALAPLGCGGSQPETKPAQPLTPEQEKQGPPPAM
jgi:hypothetical protein